MTILLLLLQEPVGWWETIEKRGWPYVLLMMVAAFTKWVVWPRVSQHLDDQRAAAIKAAALLESRAEKLELREETLLRGFGDILERNADRNQKQLEVLEGIATITKDTNGVVHRLEDKR